MPIVVRPRTSAGLTQDHRTLALSACALYPPWARASPGLDACYLLRCDWRLMVECQPKVKGQGTSVEPPAGSPQRYGNGAGQ